MAGVIQWTYSDVASAGKAYLIQRISLQDIWHVQPRRQLLSQR